MQVAAENATPSALLMPVLGSPRCSLIVRNLRCPARRSLRHWARCRRSSRRYPRANRRSVTRPVHALRRRWRSSESSNHSVRSTPASRASWSQCTLTRLRPYSPWHSATWAAVAATSRLCRGSWRPYRARRFRRRRTRRQEQKRIAERRMLVGSYADRAHELFAEKRGRKIGLRSQLSELRRFEIVRLEAHHVISRNGVGFGVHVDLARANAPSLRID